MLLQLLARSADLYLAIVLREGRNVSGQAAGWQSAAGIPTWTSCPRSIHAVRHTSTAVGLLLRACIFTVHGDPALALLAGLASTADEPSVTAARAERKAGDFMFSKREVIGRLDSKTASGVEGVVSNSSTCRRRPTFHEGLSRTTAGRARLYTPYPYRVLAGSRGGSTCVVFGGH